MALVVEDGSIVAGANSYVTAAELNAYVAARGAFLSGDNGSAEQVLLQAMDYVESLTFIGFKKTEGQALQWPRTGVVIDGYAFPDSAIPKELKAGQIQVAISIDAGVNPLSTLGRETKREKVDVIEVEYSDSASETETLRAVNAAFDKIVVGGGTSSSYGIHRA